jgi:hypothetical protein
MSGNGLHQIVAVRRLLSPGVHLQGVNGVIPAHPRPIEGDCRRPQGRGQEAQGMFSLARRDHPIQLQIFFRRGMTWFFQ